MTQARTEPLHRCAALCLLLAAVACQVAERAPGPLPAAHGTADIEALLGNLIPAPADLVLRPLGGQQADARLRVTLDEAVTLHGDRIPPVSFRLEGAWEGSWRLEEGTEVFRATSCRASANPAVDGFEQAVCQADVAGRGDAAFRGVLARLEGQRLKPGQVLPVDLGEIAVGKGRARLSARVSVAGQLREEGRDLPVLRLELTGSAAVDAKDDPVFTGHLDGQVEGLAAVTLAPAGEGLRRLDGVTILRFEGDVLDHDGTTADHLRQVQSFRVTMTRLAR